jgi:predicted GNAT family acetyltransferase
MAITVQDNPGASQYELFDGARLIGLAQYQLRDPLIAFTHTEVDPGYEHQGLGTELVQAALDDARAHGWRVLPYCPFVARYIHDNPGYVDLVPEGRRASFGLAKQEG